MSAIIKTDSKYLHGEELQRSGVPCEFVLTIKSVGERDSEKAENGQIIKGYPVRFDQTDRTLVLNQTNTKLAVAALETNVRGDWVGKKLTLYPSVLAECFGQRDVLCVRVRVPTGYPKPFIMPKHLGRDITQKETARKPKEDTDADTDTADERSDSDQ